MKIISDKSKILYLRNKPQMHRYKMGNTSLSKSILKRKKGGGKGIIVDCKVNISQKHDTATKKKKVK